MMLRTFKALLAAGGMMVLILDGATALRGAAAGIGLCLKTVIPSLFPFLFLCSVLTGALWGSDWRILHPLTARLGIPAGGTSLLISAFLGGYPAGAQQIGAAYGEKRLTRQEAENLLRFCSNAGPAFLFGMTACCFPSPEQVWALWIVHILSALMVGRMGISAAGSAVHLPRDPESISMVLAQSVKTMALLCGWILLFQILLAFLNRWFFWYCSVPIQVILTGLLELSSGCLALSRLESPELRFLCCSAMLACGGLCVTMQTASVIRGLSLSVYLRGKLYQTMAALLLSAFYLRWGWAGLAPWILIFLLPGKKRWISPKNQCIMHTSPSGG